MEKDDKKIKAMLIMITDKDFKTEEELGAQAEEIAELSVSEEDGKKLEDERMHKKENEGAYEELMTANQLPEIFRTKEEIEQEKRPTILLPLSEMAQTVLEGAAKDIEEGNWNEEKEMITEHDIPWYVDYFFAVMNLEAAEEHLEMTASMTGNSLYLEIANELSEIRNDICKIIEPNHDPNIHCLSKHLKLALKRLEETGIKYARIGEYEKAMKFLNHSKSIYKLYWAIHNIKEDKP